MNSNGSSIDDLVKLNQITAKLNQAVDVQAALNETLTTLISLMDLKTGWIFLLDETSVDSWWGKGYSLAAHQNLPPAMELRRKEAWFGGCDCQGFCTKGKLTEAYNEVRCSRLHELSGDSDGLVVHASAPLQSGSRVLGILNVAAPNWESFTPRALALLGNVGVQLGIALERANLYDMLRERRINEQAALLELSNQLLLRSDLNELMQLIVNQAQKLVDAKEATLLARGDDANHLILGATSDTLIKSELTGQSLVLDAELSAIEFIRKQEAIVSDDTGEHGDSPDQPIRWWSREDQDSATLIPLLIEEDLIGALLVQNRSEQQFDKEDIKFLQLMANQAAIALEKARLHQEEIQRRQMERELEVGRQIQLSLLPKSAPTRPGWEFEDYYEAARIVGGDFYDYFVLDPDSEKLGLLIGDVADKGVPAALFMGVSRAIIRSVAQSEMSPAAALERANLFLNQETASYFFLSVFYGLLDTTSGRLRYANAGHNPPLHYRATSGEFDELFSKGIVLCVLDEIELLDKEIDMAVGDVLVLYTDGLSEAMTGDYKEFGTARLKDVIATNAGKSAKHICRAIIQSITEFVSGADQSDDFTLVVVKRIAED